MAEVLFEQRGVCGVITLNRPESLNALTLGMVRAIVPHLTAWATDERIAHILIKGAGEKGFCAGGDIRALYDWGKVGAPEMTGFYRAEYGLNRMIKRFPKPYIALMDGITMGGGVGVSVHGAYRLVTDRTLFAMPETGIGLLPDVGGTYFLPRLPGKIGTYLALTGARLKAADCLYSGIATHYLPQQNSAALMQALYETDDAAAAISAHCAPALPAPLADICDMIDTLFAGETVQDILSALKKHDSPWAQQQYDIIRAKSPTSCAVALRQMRDGAKADFEACMRMEMRAVSRIMQGHDFYEGVRAVIIDKDNRPTWQPAAFDAVTPDMVDAIFAPLGDDELVFSP